MFLADEKFFFTCASITRYFSLLLAYYSLQSMRNYFYTFLFCCTLVACKKTSNQPTPPVTGWRAVAPLPGNRTFATSFTLNNKGYICGGWLNASQPDGTVDNDKNMYVYDPSTNKWATKTGLQADYTSADERKYPFSFIINNTAYAGGGVTLSGGAKNDIFKYDPVNDQWTELLPIDSRFHFDQAVATDYNNKAYIFNITSGGAVAWVYDPVSNQVAEAGFDYNAPPIFANIWVGSTGSQLLYGSYTSYAYFMGINTVTNERIPFQAVEYYPGLPDKPVATPKGIFYKNSMYVSFGDMGHLYRYNFTAQKWQIVISQDLGVTEGATSFLIGSKFYVAGGVNADLSLINSVYVIDLDAYPEN